MRTETTRAHCACPAIRPHRLSSTFVRQTRDPCPPRAPPRPPHPTPPQRKPYEALCTYETSLWYLICFMLRCFHVKRFWALLLLCVLNVFYRYRWTLRSHKRAASESHDSSGIWIDIFSILFGLVSARIQTVGVTDFTGRSWFKNTVLSDRDFTPKWNHQCEGFALYSYCGFF